MQYCLSTNCKKKFGFGLSFTNLLIIWIANLESESNLQFLFSICHSYLWTTTAQIIRSYLYLTQLIIMISDHFRFALAHIGRVGSTLATLMVTIERFIAVVYPLRAIQKCTSLILMRCCFLVAIIYNLPRFFEFQTVPLHEIGNSLHEENKTTNQTGDKEISEVCLTF